MEANDKLDTAVVVSNDPHVVSTALRRFREFGFDAEGLPFALETPARIASARASLVVLDGRVAGPLFLQAFQGLAGAAETAHLPLLLFDPDGAFEFDPRPFDTLASLEDLRLPALLQEAARAGERYRRSRAGRRKSALFSPGARQRFLEFLKRHTGMVLLKSAEAHAEDMIRKRMFAKKFTSAWEYLNFLQFHDVGGCEFARLLPAVTVGETSFFRTQSHFNALKNVVIPDLLYRKHAGRQKIRAWSAGCATGEEPYSIAMTFHQEVGNLDQWDFSVFASDVDGCAIRKARAGVYRQKEAARIPAPIRERYFTAVGGEYILDETIKNLVEFRTLNLNDWSGGPAFEGVEPGFDVIFCENVIIYFEKPVIEQFVRRLFNVLKPGGYLFLGYSESLYKFAHRFENVSYQDTFFYRRPLEEVRPHPAAETKPQRSKTTPSQVRPRERRRPPREKNRPSPPDPANRARPPQPAKATTPPSGPEQTTPTDRTPLPERLRLAFEGIRAGDFPDAASRIEAHLKERPLDPEAHYLMGLAEEGRGNDLDAALEWRRALFLAPGHVASHLRLGDHLARAGEGKKAILHFRNALKALQEGADPLVRTPEGTFSGPELVHLCKETVRALETEEVTR